jgi:carbon storage regulator CsrA
MLVLSRRLQEKLYFPGIRLIVHVLSIRCGAVRLGIEAPPEVTVLREDVQAPPIAEQLLDTESGEGDRDVMVRGIDQVLRVASDGLEMARLQLEAGRTRDAKELLDTVQGHLGWLQWRLRWGRRKAAPIRPREGA